ncbi:MAG: Holliday junction resolvase Hjc [Candidatus Woesearchaeota archaeon]
MSTKSKGSNAERELVHMFWENDWACIRAAGSGSTRFCSPDILAGNSLRRLAIECKSTSAQTQYLTKKEVEDLIFFSKKFGAEAWVGVRFTGMKWFFVNVEDLKDTGKYFSVSMEMARFKGLIFDELIQKF